MPYCAPLQQHHACVEYGSRRCSSRCLNGRRGGHRRHLLQCCRHIACRQISVQTQLPNFGWLSRCDAIRETTFCGQQQLLFAIVQFSLLFGRTPGPRASSPSPLRQWWSCGGFPVRSAPRFCLRNPSCSLLSRGQPAIGGSVRTYTLYRSPIPLALRSARARAYLQVARNGKRWASQSWRSSFVN